MRSILLAIAFLTITIGFESCSKFEDGPKITLRTVKQRLYGDRWFAASTTVASDSSYYNKFDNLSFYEYSNKTNYGRYGVGGANSFGIQAFKIENDNELMFDTTGGLSYVYFGTITRLTKKEMHISNVFNTTEKIIYER